MGDVTIVYYTSNREHPDLEQKIVENLVEMSKGIPIISVSQKPMNLGKNICVGDVGMSILKLVETDLDWSKRGIDAFHYFRRIRFFIPRGVF